jgi:hypothetical protein
MVGEQRTMVTPACLNCGWIGSDGTRPEAEAEGEMDERGERQPWVMTPGQNLARKASHRLGQPNKLGPPVHVTPSVDARSLGGWLDGH